ncbi:MAG TPA: tetratricopeptide repeat protein [Thermodesulfovibrionales bacterium]|nr:tetratricopeptide repeat protein [Thermodesulfovibrionales bacterium]
MGKASRKKEVIGKTSDTRPVNSVDKTMSESSREALLCVAVIILVSFAVYFNALFNGFVYDDMHQVLENPWIKDIRHLSTIFSNSVWSFHKDAQISNYYRPMMHVIYMLNYYCFGLRPWGFHLVNILFHVGVSVLVFIITKKLLKEYGPLNPCPVPEGSDWGILSAPFIAALLFATHPVHTEAVTWVAGLPEVSYTFFYLLSFYFYIRSSGGLDSHYLTSVLFFSFAAFSKETALTLPVVLVAYDFAFRNEGNRFFACWKRYIPYLVTVGIYLIARFHALESFVPIRSYTDLSAYQYVINAFPLFMKYIEKLLLPVNLNFWHTFHPISSVFETEGLLSLTVVAVFGVSSLIFMKKNKVAFFILLLVVVPLLPVLYIPGISGKPFAERYLYLPSSGYAILIAIFLSWLKGKLSPGALVITLSLIVLTGLFIFGSVSRNSTWKDDYTLFADTVGKSPDVAETRNNLGKALADRGRFDEAIEQFWIALRIKPGSADTHNYLGIAYYKKGWIDKAVEQYQIALTLKPDYAEAHNNVGIAYREKGWIDQAIERFQIALQLYPDYADARNNIGIAYTEKGWIDKAVAQYQIALTLKPDYAEAHNNLGSAYYMKGWIDNAVEQYQIALNLKPDYAEAHLNLGIMYLRKDTADMARREFESALRLDPDNFRARQILNSIDAK